MTSKKISAALQKISNSRKSGFQTEALIRTYHLNLDLIRFLLSKTAREENLSAKKGKELIQELLNGVEQHPPLKALITKKSIKSLKPWIGKMDAFFKTLKTKSPQGIPSLLNEGEKILALLNISANKLLIKS